MSRFQKEWKALFPHMKNKEILVDFAAKKSHPMRELVTQTGNTRQQIDDWFTNYRKRGTAKCAPRLKNSELLLSFADCEMAAECIEILKVTRASPLSAFSEFEDEL